jgi:hypothetical protein
MSSGISRGSMAPHRLFIVSRVSPIKASPGRFDARFVITDERLVGSSRQPFADTARMQIDHGPAAALAMKPARLRGLVLYCCTDIRRCIKQQVRCPKMGASG